MLADLSQRESEASKRRLLRTSSIDPRAGQRVLVRALPAKMTMQKAALVFVLLWIGVLVAVRAHCATPAPHFADCLALQCGR